VIDKTTKVFQYSGRSVALIIFLLALLIRVIFFFFGTPVYFGEAGIHVGGDTGWWTKAVENLIEFGTYSTDLNMPNGYFYRPPGYAIFLAPLKVFLGDWDSVYRVFVIIQIILDSFVAVIFFKIALLITEKIQPAIIAGLLYSLYVFSFGWTPVIYPESLSVFFLSLGVFFFLKALKSNLGSKHMLISGVCLGIAALMRIQLVLLLPIPLVIFLIYNYKGFSFSSLKPYLFFIFGVIFTYGLWPARNLINHQKPVFTQRLDDARHWSSDFMAFREFMWAIKTDVEPEFTQLMAGENINWPKSANLSKIDSLEIKKALILMDSCGVGFRTWRMSNGYEHMVTSHAGNCNSEIALLWNNLTTRQKKNNTLHYSIQVPLQNLKKVFFKSDLVGGRTLLIVKIAFGLRSGLILFGLAGIVYMLRKQKLIFRQAGLFILAIYLSEVMFFCFWFRSIEIRYFLQIDSLLLIPAGVFLSFVLKLLKQKWKTVI